MSHVTNCCRCGGSCYDDPTSSQLFLHPGYMHNAVLQPLQPARRYCCSFTSHVTRHTSHVTRHTSHVTRHTSHAGTTTRLAAAWVAGAKCTPLWRPASRAIPRLSRSCTSSTLLCNVGRVTGVQVHCRCRRGTATQARARRRLPQRRPAQWSRQGVCSHYKGRANETGRNDDCERRHIVRQGLALDMGALL